VDTLVSPSPRKYKTFTYHNHLDWTKNKSGDISSHLKPSLHVSAPPEFKGEAGVWTPEDLLVAAVNICQMTTFMSFAQRQSIAVQEYRCAAEGLLEFVDGNYQITKIILKPSVTVELLAEIVETERIMEEAHQRCLIANSVKSEVIIQHDIRSRQQVFM